MSLQQTPLHAAHVALGAKMVPFGGWDMPVQYAGILAEHLAVRQHVGLFDISHMGEFIITGTSAEATLNRLFTNDVRKVAVGQAQHKRVRHVQGWQVLHRQPDRIQEGAGKDVHVVNGRVAGMEGQ